MRLPVAQSEEHTQHCGKQVLMWQVLGATMFGRTHVQVVVRYVAMTPDGRVFESSLEKGPFDIR
jgi:hypothetical protein